MFRLRFMLAWGVSTVSAESFSSQKRRRASKAASVPAKS